MATTKDKTAAAQAARDAAAAAIDDARTLAGLLPKKRAKKLHRLAEEAGPAATASDAKIARHPKRTRRRAAEATARLAKATKKARRRLATDASEAAPIDAETLAAAQASVTPSPGLEALTLFDLRAQARDAGHDDVADLSRAQLIALLS